MTSREAPVSQPQGEPEDEAEDLSSLEVLALVLQAALNKASALPFVADQIYLTVGLQVVHDDVLQLLVAGHEISPEVHETAQPYVAPAAELEDPAASVVRLLEEAGGILAGLPVLPGSSELTIKVADLLREAKSAASS